MRPILLCGLLLAAVVPCAPARADAPGYFRDPTAQGDTLVFTAEGDLWRASIHGGAAQRLTSHAGEERHAALSPDGRWLAFTASYDGPPEAYVMPLAGGEPQRLTVDGAARVLGWTPQGEVLVGLLAAADGIDRRVVQAIDPASGAVRALPLADVSDATDAGGTVFFTRFGLQLTGDQARQYRGGAAGQLWRFNPAQDREATRLAADWAASIERPMAWNDRVLVVADADGNRNLWSLDRDGGDRTALTAHRDFEVRGARLAGDRVVYQHGADLRVLDLRSGEDRVIALQLVSDFEQRRTRWLQTPLDYLSDLQLAHDGARVAITARGRIALAGPGPQRRVEIALPPEARARAATPAHDGRSVFALSDQSGEQELWRFPADGGPGEQLTRDGSVERTGLWPSPDGRHVAHSDKAGRLWLLDLASGRNRVVDRSADGDHWSFDDLRWSPDGQAMAYVRPDGAQPRPRLVLLDLRDGTPRVLTSDKYESASPAFSRDGRWLYFLSDRHFQATPGNPWGDRTMGPMFDRRTRVYALALQPGQRFPFQPADELEAAAPAAASTAKDSDGTKAAAKSAAPALPAIVLDGLAERLFEVPLPPGNLRQLAADAARLYWIEADPGGNGKGTLKTLPIGNRGEAPETFASGVRGYSLSGDGQRVAYSLGGDGQPPEIYIVPAAAKAPGDLGTARVRLDDWRLRIEPAREWTQLYHDAWRMHRDALFDRSMRGQSWPALRDKYAALLPRLTDRAELDDLLGQLTGELGVLHSQVRSTDQRRDLETAQPAFLGAELRAAGDGVEIVRIWATEAELPGERGPLQRPGVDVRAGDRITAVNGQPVRSVAGLATSLQNQAGQQVLLALSRGSTPHRAVVTPVDAARESALRYGHWVQGRRAAVEAAGQGRIGYLHLRAMGPGDIAQFAREFFAQVDRDALVIDVRRNRGGNIDSWIIGTLLRRAWAFWHPPGGRPYWNMQQTFRGHLAVLIDPLTYSDGETFAAGVQTLGLGPLIGQRTAGAGVWLSDRNRLSDGGIARVAEFAQFNADGAWMVEGHGVAPDIAVENLPHASWNGGDAQLDAAIAHLQARLAAEPPTPAQAQSIPPLGQTGR